VCFLEHDFPISFHSPRIPREVLACGRCLISTQEIVSKQPFAKSLVDGRNIAIVSNPAERDELTGRLVSLLNDRDARHSIGRHGLFLSRVFESRLPQENATADALDEFLKAAVS
jgi:hypothetical protein